MTAKLYLVKTMNGRWFYAAGNYTYEAEEAVVNLVSEKNVVASVTPIKAPAVQINRGE